MHITEAEAQRAKLAAYHNAPQAAGLSGGNAAQSELQYAAQRLEEIINKLNIRSEQLMEKLTPLMIQAPNCGSSLGQVERQLTAPLALGVMDAVNRIDITVNRLQTAIDNLAL